MAGCLALAAVLAFGVVWASESQGRDAIHVVLSAQLVVVALGLLLVRLHSGHLSIFNPMVLFLVAFPVLYFWPALQLLRGQDSISRLFVPWLPNDLALQLRAAKVALAGLISVCVGHVAANVIPLRQRSRKAKTSRLPSGHVRLGITGFIGIALFAGFIFSVGGVGSLLNNLSNRTVFTAGLNYLGSGPMVLAAAGVARLIADHKWPPTLAVRALLTGSMLLLFFLGSKAVIAVFVLVVAAIVNHRYRKLNILWVASAALLASLGLGTYDLYFRDALPNRRPLTAVVRENGGIVQALQTQLLGGNAFGQQALAIAIYEFPNNAPYEGFKTIESLALSPVPRRLYPNKPSAPSATFTKTFAPAFLKQGSTIPPTAFGEMYMCFGVMGVVVGAALLGALLNVAYRVRHFGDKGLLLSALVLADVVHYMRGETYGAAVLFLLIWIPARWSLGRQTEEVSPKGAKPFTNPPLATQAGVRAL